MRILGIDPGVARVGWGVVEVNGTKLTMDACGCLETSKKGAFGERLLVVNKFITKLVDEYKPDTVSVEKLYFSANSQTAMMVGEGRGVIILAVASSGIRLAEYTPLQIKMALTGYGRAEKDQVKVMVKKILGLDRPPRLDDTADALAVAITHAFSYKMRGLSLEKKENRR